ncbi:MAG: ABC-F family ATP-binding cassette domain-containing protein, partial [Candidatus Glassbacteria bacterium]
MTLVSFNNVAKSFSGQVLFSGVTGIIRSGDRIGVVGPNGSGKTTFCRILAGLEPPEEGTVHLGKNIGVRHMDQEASFSGERGVLDELLASCTQIRELEKKIRDMAGRLDSGEKLDQRELERYGEMLDRFEHLGGWSLESRAAKILTGLGLGRETFGQPVGSLSGGQRSRLGLATALIGEPDLLFLDEPTNHLDLAAIEFLEGLIAETRSTVVVVSHDRAFLDNVTTRTIEILDGRVTLRDGNYSEFSRWAEEEAERLEREHRNYERKVEKIEDFIRRNIYGQKTRQAQSRRKMLARMKPPPKSRRRMSAPSWEIEQSQRSGGMVLEARALAHAWPGGGQLFERLDLTISRGETLAVIGANGTGKSTLLEILAGRLSPTAGLVTWGKDVTIEILPQRVERPAGTLSVLDFMYSRAPELTLGEVRSHLGRFLFSG